MHPCTGINLGDKGRAAALRQGVFLAGVALFMALALYELKLVPAFGWLLVLPVAASVYSVISGTCGICAFHGMKGERGTDHGTEVVLDGESRSRVLKRALLAVSASLVAGGAIAAVFVASV